MQPSGQPSEGSCASQSIALPVVLEPSFDELEASADDDVSSTPLVVLALVVFALVVSVRAPVDPSDDASLAPTLGPHAESSAQPSQPRLRRSTTSDRTRFVGGWCREADSNRRPRGYESLALNQLSYLGRKRRRYAGKGAGRQDGAVTSRAPRGSLASTSRSGHRARDRGLARGVRRT
jgi:hypothetical protein